MKKNRHFVSIAVGAAGACLLVVLLYALTVQVRATADAETAVSQAENTVAQNGPDLSPLMLDSYDGTFTTSYSIQREITHTGSAAYEWGRVITSSSQFTDTLWCVRGGQHTYLNPDTGQYVPNVTTTITYGPLDLHQVVTAELTFRHWISVASGDGLAWGYSTDGSTFTFADVTPGAPGSWETKVLNSSTDPAMSPLLGKHQVYLAFRFASNGDGQVGRGVFLDDVQLKVRYAAKAYLPVMTRSWFLEYTYREAFEPPYSNWPYGSVRNASLPGQFSDGYMAEEFSYDYYGQDASQVLTDGLEFGPAVAEEFSYGYKQDGDGSNVYYINIRDNFDHVFVTGPAYVMGKHWEYEGWLRRASDQSVDLREYGILISPTPIKASQPQAEGVYTFQIRMWADGVWVVKKWDIRGIDSRSGHEIEKGETSKLTTAVKQWNQFRIERNGDTLYFKLTHGSTSPSPSDYKTVYTLTDPNLPDMFYVGFFAANREITASREWQFDNVYVHAAPR